jgi:hypothetical protein
VPASKVPTSWDRYMRWNEALANAVYRPEAAGTPVYLDMEDELLARVAVQVGDTPDEPRQQLTSAVQATLNTPSDSTGVFGQHIRALHRWRPETGDSPPIIGLLAVLCLAAEEMREADGFASNNYYDRLMPLLGIQPSAKDRVVAAYRKHSADMWETLNTWLEGLHGERGLPTAYAYSHAHIGRPLSQALIRAADREKLYDFFSDQGLEQRSRLSPQDMEPMLSEWIARVPSPASNQLRALWKRPGARERITDIACQLLETWEPSAGASVSSHVARTAHRRGSLLRLLALLRTFPDTILELNLIGPGLGGEHLVSLIDPQSGAELGVDFEVEDLPDGRWRLARMDHLEERSLLEGRVCLRQPAGALFERRPRRLVPLKKDPLLQFFVEVERLGLGEDGLLLCQSVLATWVQDALAKIARPGFRRLDPSPGGCPEGWIVFAGVQVVVALSSVAPRAGAWPLDLNVLQPVATSQLLLEGGLQLPGRIRRWSSLVPPEIRAASEEAAGITISVEQVGAFQHAEKVLEVQADAPAVMFALSDVHLPDGDYDVSAEVAEVGSSRRRPLNTTRLRLRSADNPHPLPIGQMRLARPVDSMPVAVISAQPWDGRGGAIRGAAMEGQRARHEELRSAQVGQPGWWTRRQQSRSAPSSDNGYFVRRVTLPTAGPEDCFRTGAHYIDLPTYYGKTSKSTIDGICRYCGLVKRYPARHRLRRQERAQAAHFDVPSLDVSSVTSVGFSSAIGPDTTFDALSHDQAGPMAWFEQLALQVEPSQLFADRFLRALESLGHIEVSRDVRRFAPMSWEVLPPVLAGLPAGGFVLTGFRSHRLTTAIEAEAEADGFAVKRLSQAPGAPVCMSVSAGSAEQAAALAERVSQGTEIGMTVAPDASYVLARALPPLGAVIEALPRQAMVATRGVRRWDAGLARWTTCDDAHMPGCYQLAAATTIYCLRDEADVAAGTMRRMDARLVKHAGARAAGESMIGYVERNQGLYLPLGADLPGMYGRVAVLCSGLLPTDDDKQRLVHYHRVPREIASHLAALLTA